MSNPVIKNVPIADLPRVMELVGAVVAWMQAGGSQQWDDTYPNIEVMTKDIEQDGLIGIYLDDVLYGFAAVDYTPHKEYYEVEWACTKAPILIAHRIVVDPSLHGKGLAKIIMAAIEARAREVGAHAIHTDTHHGNVSMAAVFNKCGYTKGAPIILDHKKDIGAYFVYEKVLK